MWIPHICLLWIATDNVILNFHINDELHHKVILMKQLRDARPPSNLCASVHVQVNEFAGRTGGLADGGSHPRLYMKKGRV